MCCRDLVHSREIPPIPRRRALHLLAPALLVLGAAATDPLFHDPDNEHARLGLIRLAEHYLEAAQTALENDQLLKADSLVSKARMIDPDYPAVASLQRQIDLLEQAERTRETLDWQLVANRSPTLTDQLLRLGRLAKQGDCRVTIQVSNDAEGRWIYQNMNRASGTGRLRAQVSIASPTAVDILCFTSPTGETATSAGSDLAVTGANR
jgi:hypothetical protein